MPLPSESSHIKGKINLILSCEDVFEGESYQVRGSSY